MPEMTFEVRWPDGSAARYYSPSLVMHDYLVAGTSYTVADFADRSDRALIEAGERVRAKFGFACTSAAATNAQIADTACRYPSDALIDVIAMQPGLETI
ncbi:MAG: MSMEG_0570 family nitrogen starvation response protein [Actinobacteria bacterium]|nr:MSMEG_0570 family nitrogen starvation response protein [Actinomycetota bacterium]